MARTQNKLNALQTIKLGDQLRQVCSSVGGYSVYSEGWDDEKVAKAMGDEYVANNVASLRRVLFGEMPPRRKPPTLQQLQQRIEALEEWAAARPVVPFREKDKT